MKYQLCEKNMYCAGSNSAPAEFACSFSDIGIIAKASFALAYFIIVIAGVIDLQSARYKFV